MRGVFLERPTLPKYNNTWDVSQVLTYLKSLSPVHELSLLCLSHKLVMLLALLSSQRKQSLHLIDIRNISIRNDTLLIRIGDLLKQTRPGHHIDEITITAYPKDRDLCIVTVYLEYVSRTSSIRDSETKLFVSTQKPHKAVSKDTIGRWIKTVMDKAGIDTSIFTPHSTRAAATSAAVKAKVSVDTILKTAGWTRDNVFRKHYNKPVVVDDTFSKNLLDTFST